MRKINQWLAGVLTTAVLCSGCAALPLNKDAASVQPETKSADQENIDIRSGRPWINSDIEGAVTADMKIRLEDDFAAAVNQKWLSETKLEEEEDSRSNYDDVINKTSDQILELITNEVYAEKSEEIRQMQECYKLWLDWEERNRLGISPLMPTVEKLKAIQTRADLDSFLKLPEKERDGVRIAAYAVEPSFRDSSRYIVWIGPSGLSLNDSAEYQDMTEESRKQKAAADKLTGKLLVKAGFCKEETAAIIENAFRFETLLAPSIMTSLEQKSPDAMEKQDHLITGTELLQLQGEVPITEMLLQSGFEEKDLREINLQMPAWLETLKNLYTEENVPLIRDYLLIGYLKEYAADLDRECYEWTIDESNELNGTDGYGDDGDSACNAVQGLLDEQISKAYSEIYFTKEDKDILTKLTEEIIKEYREMLKEEDFLTEQTKQYAIEKLDSMKINILYPETWPDFSNLKIKGKEEGGTYWDAARTVKKFKTDCMMQKLSDTGKRPQWNRSVLTTEVNCYHNLVENSINILAAWCQELNYNKEMQPEVLYARIGYVIGHEISHAFDSKGAQFDKNGNLANWWETSDLEKFKKKNERLAEYYNEIVPWEGAHIIGSIVTGEAGADMTSIKCMLRMAEKIPGFDYDKFFRAYAEGNRSCTTLEYQQDILEDVHPLSYLRTNTVLQQFDKFFETYSIKEGDGMYLAPEKRVIIW